MITVNSTVRHLNPKINKMKGVMKVYAIKGQYTTCGAGNFENLGIE